MKFDIEAFARELQGTIIDGWEFFYDLSAGSIGFMKNDCAVYCTPYYEDSLDDVIPLQILNAQGCAVGKGDEEIPFTAPLTKEKFVALMTDELPKAQKAIDKDAACPACDNPECSGTCTWTKADWDAYHADLKYKMEREEGLR